MIYSSMASSSILEYARYHDLAINHKTDNLRNHLTLFSPLAFPDEASLLPFELPSACCDLPEEKLQFSQDAGRLLGEAPKAPACVASSQLLADPHKIENMKMEVTMLRSNHERDMKWFRSGVDLKKMIEAEVHACGSENCDESRLPELSDICTGAVTEMRKNVHNERFEVGVEVLHLLRQSTHSVCAQADRELCMQSHLSRSKASSRYDGACWSPKSTQKTIEDSPLTPFLTPLLSPLGFQPPVLDMPALALDRVSDVSIDNDSFCQVAQQADEVDTLRTSDISNGSPNKVRSLLQQSSNAPAYDASQQNLDVYTSYDNETTKPGFDAESLKVEVPMMPLRRGSGLEPKESGKTMFEDMMEDFIDLSPMQVYVGGGGEYNTDQDDAVLLDRIVNHSNEVRKAVILERIGVNDAALRVEVKQLSRATFLHPAKNTSKHDMLESALAHQQVKQVTLDPVEEMSMTWIPVPKCLMRLDMKESIEHTDILKHLIAVPENIIRSEQLLWKEPGLRILDNDNEDESETEEMSENPSLQLIPGSESKTSVPTKRPAEDESMVSNKRMGSFALHARSDHRVSPHDLVDEIESTQDNPGHHQDIQQHPSGLETLSTQRQSNSQAVCFPPPSLPPARTLGPFKPKPFKMPHFSASGSVSLFLDLQGKQFKPPSIGVGRDDGSTDPSYDPIEVSQVPLDERQASDSDPWTSIPSESVQVPATPSQAMLKQQSAAEIKSLGQARTIVIDSALVNNRTLMALLDSNQEQQLTTIYRDLKGCPDLVLSPHTCLIYTNLQALTQRGLPGQSSKNMLKGKIAQLAATYESLYVMVSTSTQVLGFQNDVVADFTFFCSSFQMKEMPVKVIPLWIPIAEGRPERWSEDPMALNTWKVVLQEGFRNSSKQLGDQTDHQASIIIQDETVWEAFLCRAGTNPMAAQVILGMLKKSDAGKEVWGLRKLVRMDSEERMQRLARLVGKRCIAHLNYVLESTCL